MNSILVFNCMDNLVCVQNDINVKCVDKCIRQLKTGKAAGLDSLEAERSLFAHPLLVVLLSLLFKMMLMHSMVHDGFGLGIVIPLVKYVGGDKCSTENYRDITLCPVVSKLFELVLVLMEMFSSLLVSDNLQFGFKVMLFLLCVLLLTNMSKMA